MIDRKLARRFDGYFPSTAMKRVAFFEKRMHVHRYCRDIEIIGFVIGECWPVKCTKYHAVDKSMEFIESFVTLYYLYSV